MSNRPQMTGACCPKGDSSVTQLRLSEEGGTVGIVGLKEVFGQLLAMGRTPEDLTQDELVGMVRARKNYIPHQANIEAVYSAALRREYGVSCEHRSRP
jgi:hypothetical protein